MNDVIHLSFRYSNDDIARATRSHYAWRMRPRLDLVMALLPAAAALTCCVLRVRPCPVCSLWARRVPFSLSSSPHS